MELDQKHNPPQKPITEIVRRMATGLDSVPNPPADPETISQLEQKLGQPLPPSYKEVLRELDGGTFFQTLELYGANPVNKMPDIESLMRIMRQKGLPPNLIPVGESVLTVCLDTSRPDTEQPEEYKITLWNKHSGLMKDDERTFERWLKDIADQYS